MDEHILSRILNGEASPDEKASFFEGLKNDNNEQEIYYQVKSLWVRVTSHKTKVDVDSEFDTLWQKIQKSETKTISLYRKILQYAAVAIVLIGIGTLAGYFLSTNHLSGELAAVQHYSSMKGSVSSLELADGTKVWLNSDTKLSYCFDKKEKRRFAELSGEAYFEVAHNDKYPFMVKVGELTIRDLGTTFNIKAYSDDQIVETSLIEGKVDLLNAKNKIIMDLQPGERATYYPAENKIETGSVSINVLNAWREGKFIVRDQKLEEIFKEISRWYDVKFQFENESLKSQRFTGNLKKSTSLQSVMNIIKQASNFNYRIVEQQDEPDIIIIY